MSTSVQCGGMITKQGEAEIEERGIYLMLNPEPSASDSTIRIDMEADSFYCTISDLKPETTYYVRAYAKSKYGEYNGAKVETFKTTNGRPVLDDNKFKKICDRVYLCGVLHGNNKRGRFSDHGMWFLL